MHFHSTDASMHIKITACWDMMPCTFHWLVLMFWRNLVPPPSDHVPQAHNLNIHCYYNLKSKMSTCVTGARMWGWLQWWRTWACWCGRGRWKPSAARSTVRQRTRWCYDTYEHLHDLWFTCQSHLFEAFLRLCCKSRWYLLASHSGVSGSVLGIPCGISDLQWQWGRFLSKQLSFCQCSTLTFLGPRHSSNR